jgi:hypothetical protein
MNSIRQFIYKTKKDQFIYIWKLLMIQNPKFLNKICTTCVLLKKIQTIVTCQKQRQQQNEEDEV